MIRREYWERSLQQTQQDHERKESIQQDVKSENQNTFENVKERQLHEATCCPFCAWCVICVKGKSYDRKHAKTSEESGAHSCE